MNVFIKKKKKRHSTQAVTVLRTWFWDHLLTSTYPTDEDMMYLREHTQLDDARVCYFIVSVVVVETLFVLTTKKKKKKKKK